MKKSICIIASVLLFAACANENSTLDMKGMFSPNGETIDARFEQSLAYNAARGEIHMDMQADDYTIYVCTDSHITRKTHRNLDYFVAQYRAAAAPKIALHLGDVIDAQKNFPCADSILHFAGQTIADTLFVTPGNHDIYFKQWPIYRDFFKSSVYWFDTRNGEKKLDLFICLDSAEGELGVKQMNWLRSLLDEKSKEGYRRIIVFSHTHLWKLDASQGHTSNMALEATYEFTSLLSQYGVEYYWCGHQHARQVVRFKGVTYMVLNATKDSESGQSYMIAHMGENVSYDYIDFPKE
ncbi:MAG: metallophosphoesterase [Paludibacteraceae bacterium]|nr:metallophosphoesterase [Paludibacteraceae bacterium]